MSLQSLTSVHTLAVTRLAVTKDTTGGQVRTYTAAARGSRPTSVTARACLMSDKERSQFGVRGDVAAYKFLTTTDPQIALNDQVEFDYVSGQTELVKIITPSRALHPSGRLWRFYGEVDTTDT